MTTTTVTKPAAILPPPTERYTVLGWLRKNLFASWLDSILTLIALAIVIRLVVPGYHWATTEARWDVIPANLALLLKGQYPLAEMWRLWLCLYLLAALFGLIFGVFVRRRETVGWLLLVAPVALAALPMARESGAWMNLLLLDGIGLAGYALGRWRGRQLARPTIIFLLLYFPLVILLVRGFGSEGFLTLVTTNLWGGLMLSLLIAVVGIVFSFPLGVALALGRQSSLPAIRTLSVLYIELIRGVPLITLLFMGQVMLPFFLPAGMTVDRVIRAMVAVILFAAAYLAENVRGGLQSIPKGQYEAADAVGLSGFHKMTYIILPQALRAVIPVLVGQFIALFKDTSLVALVGLLDLLGIARGVLANPNFIGRHLEVYMFVALIYWIFCYAMSHASRRLEVSLGVGER